MRYSDINRLVRKETDDRADAFTDFLDALTLSANNVSETFGEKNDQVSARRWLRIAAQIDAVRAFVEREIRA